MDEQQLDRIAREATEWVQGQYLDAEVSANAATSLSGDQLYVSGIIAAKSGGMERPYTIPLSASLLSMPDAQLRQYLQSAIEIRVKTILRIQ